MTSLSRNEMKRVIGGQAPPSGNGSCAYSYMVDLGGGSQSQAFGSTSVTGTCAQQIAQCQAYADNLAIKLGTSVHYDSGCDGWGA